MKNGYKVMDSDLNTMEPDGLWERYLDEPFKKFAPQFLRGTDSAPNQPVIKIGDLELCEMSKRARTAVVGKELHRRTFERSPHYALAHALATALARAHNGWTHDYCQHNPGRLKFAAQVAFHDVPGAIAEARRAVRELGAVAVVGNPNPINGRHVHDPAFEPLWAAIEELGVPMGFHPTGQSSLRDDIARRYLDHPNGRVIGVAGRNPVELMMAFGSLAAGGVLERHPRLRCAFLEGTCGWLPWWLWRLDEAWEKFGPGSEVQISQLPSQYFYRQCYVATDADEAPLRQVIEAIGDDSIVVSTDYPHSDGLFPEAINEFVALEGVSDKTKAKILWDK